jgi:hypothetical protein
MVNLSGIELAIILGVVALAAWIKFRVVVARSRRSDSKPVGQGHPLE